MKTFILVDEQNIVKCMASEKCNLHKDKLWMRKYLVEAKGTVGDEYDTETDTWTPRPENYPQPSEKERREALITEKMREMAVKQLEREGRLSFVSR